MGTNLPAGDVSGQIDDIAESLRDAYEALGRLCDALGLPKPSPM